MVCAWGPLSLPVSSTIAAFTTTTFRVEREDLLGEYQSESPCLYLTDLTVEAHVLARLPVLELALFRDVES